jgi:hypothetical protein
MFTLASIKRFMNNTPENLNTRIARSRLAAPSFYLLAFMGFFFTFFNLRCGTAKLAEVSGVQMAVGGACKINTDFFSQWTEPENAEDSARVKDMRKGLFGNKNSKERLPVNYWALAAIAAALLALVGSIFHSAKMYLIQLGFTGAGILSLLMMIFTRNSYAIRMMNMDTALKKSQEGLMGLQVINLQIAFAFWVSLGALMVAFLFIIMRQKWLKAEMEQQSVLEMFDPGNEETSGNTR